MKPTKYKSIPVLESLNRDYKELSQEELDESKKIISNFIKYFKGKHL